MKYDVQDLALADKGKLRIEWANQSMPVLNLIKEEFLETKPLTGVRIAACLHVTTETASLMDMALAQSLAVDLGHYVELANQVISQTERRVFQGETVPANEKIVSIFEDHTDIIIKDNRETQYGHKICLTTGASGLVTDVVVEPGNPADSTLAVKMIERHKELFGKAPRQASFDGGFASRRNLADIKRLGVQDVAFSKRCRLEIEDMVKSKHVYRQLRAFRAGIEGTISFLKRILRLARCFNKGWKHFASTVGQTVFAHNLLILARC